ncbi:MAG: hypothetical protein QF680_02530 [Acidobacteriota bacterium]|nr:hypothetical protein [Acidobacteriota bacterium]
MSETTVVDARLDKLETRQPASKAGAWHVAPGASGSGGSLPTDAVDSRHLGRN